MSNAMYLDFNLNFQMNPISKDIAVLTNEKAISQSLKNLLMTNYGEVPFSSHIGSSISELLFEPVDNIVVSTLNERIRETIKNFEPRVKIVSIDIKDDIENNSYSVTINYKIVNTDQTYGTTISLNRLQ